MQSLVAKSVIYPTSCTCYHKLKLFNIKSTLLFIYLIERFRIFNNGVRVVFEVDNANFSQLRQVIQLISDRRLLL